MLITGVNPYGLTYTLGLQGKGTPRANPNGTGLNGFVEIASEIGARSIELPEPWLNALTDSELANFGDRIKSLGMTPVVGSGLPNGPIGQAIRPALAVGATTIRIMLTSVLCGARGALGEGWSKLVGDVRSDLGKYAAAAKKAGITLAIENHQDFGSRELVDLCEEAGPNVGICFDIANTFPVAEAPLAFAERVAPYVRHVHLKDYNVQFTDDGIRLVRCAIGDGAVPISDMVEILNEHHDSLTASLELAALDARHVKLFQPEWWDNYPQITGPELAACLAAARRNQLPDDADFRTPWESGQDSKISNYELRQLRRSVDNMSELGIMGKN